MERTGNKLAKMSHYGAYIFERLGKYIVEDERGFATYSYLETCVYIEDIYVRPEFRKQGVAASYADTICEEAREQGYKQLLGTVKPSAYGSTESLKTLLAYGMSVDSCDSELIYLTKDLSQD